MSVHYYGRGEEGRERKERGKGAIAFWCTKVRTVVKGQSTVSGFDLALFGSLSSECLCVVFGLWVYVFLFTFQ